MGTTPPEITDGELAPIDIDELEPAELLGKTLKDKLTGFSGVATGFCRYLTGCDQYNVTPKIDDDGKYPTSHWFDVVRLEVQEDVETFTLNTEKADITGCDMLPPDESATDNY